MADESYQGSVLFQSYKNCHRKIQYEKRKEKKNKQTNKAGAFTTEVPTTAETYRISCLLSDLLPKNKPFGE